LDILLVSADGWRGRATVLPAGPWRETLHSAKRASLIIVTCKTAGAGKVEALKRALAAAAPSVPQALVRLRLGDLHSTATGQTMPLTALADAKVLAIAAIANPESFFDQLTAVGADVIPRAYPDHHRFSQREAGRLAADAEAADFVVCTLKDAVKLGPLWPPQTGSLWYVSQRVGFEDGTAIIEGMLDRICD
ncbi:MAG: tetraacyldisaccharide 4'-kinase, partial [Gemmatimonadota bacterium]|nr:tetraacyldisaccharide 4'-kinase [Gemmatimonadota bacterium]